MTSKYRVAVTDELQNEGDRVITEVDGLEIAIFRIDNEYHAVLNFCPHQSGPLCDGELTGRTHIGEDGFSWRYELSEQYILCPWHGWVFDITTGKNVDHNRYVVPTFPVVEENSDIYVIR